MSDYTKMNLKEMTNSAEQYGLGEHLETRFARKPLELEQFGFSYQKMQPNFRQPFGHVHREQEEVYLVLSGSGRAKVEEEIVDLRQWDALRIPPGVTRAFEAGDDGLEYIAIGGAATDDGDLIQNWWAD